MLMRMCIPEFAGFSAEFIAANCFADKSLVSSWPVHQDEGGKLDSTRRVTMMNSEDSAANERTIHYDIRFTARVPGSESEADESLIRLIINVEIQVDDDLVYSVVTRGLYYCARMISAQYGTVFTHQEYQKLQKVYSIWICPDSTVKRNTITEYRMQEFQKLGTLTTKETDYDKLQVIVITIGPEGTRSDNSLIRFLSLLLKNELPLDSRMKQLEDEYRLKMTEEFRKGMSIVCNLGESIARRNRAEGLREGKELSTVSNLRSLMDKMKISAEKAMDYLNIPEEDQPKYALLLKGK